MKWTTRFEISLIISARCIQVSTFSSINRIPPRLCDIPKNEYNPLVPALFSSIHGILTNPQEQSPYFSVFLGAPFLLGKVGYDRLYHLMQEQVEGLLLPKKDDSSMKVDYHFQLNSQIYELEMESVWEFLTARDWYHKLKCSTRNLVQLSNA